MRRAIYIVAVCAALTVVFWFFPAFHIVSLKQANAVKELGAFSAAEFAAQFWSKRLTPALGQAPEASAVLAALSKDAKTAATNYGRTIGMSDTAYYLMRGSGTIVTVGNAGAGVSLNGTKAEADLLLKTGLLFGNTVRDATGLLSASEFPNSKNFNDISTELNRIVESRVLPSLKTNAAAGRKLRFVVCAEVLEEDAGERPLKVVPVLIEWQ